jgi:hypothetical protein
LNTIGRYLWVLLLGICWYNYRAGLRRLPSKDSGDPRSSTEGIVLRRWFAAASALPWLVWGWGETYGNVPNAWSYFRPQDRNPYVLAWFASVFLLSVCFALWVFFFDGAAKMVVLRPDDVFGPPEKRPLTVGRVKFYAVSGPFWIVLWMFFISLLDAKV